MEKFFGGIGILCCLLSSCESMVDAPETGTVVWENQSDHRMRVTAWEFIGRPGTEAPLKFDQVLQRGEQIEFTPGYGGKGYVHSPAKMYYSQMEIKFDDEITVAYFCPLVDGYYQKLVAPIDFPSEFDLTQEKNYVRSGSINKYTLTWTYTFTDADYEAARKWAEKQ